MKHIAIQSVYIRSNNYLGTNNTDQNGNLKEFKTVKAIESCIFHIANKNEVIKGIKKRVKTLHIRHGHIKTNDCGHCVFRSIWSFLLNNEHDF